MTGLPLRDDLVGDTISQGTFKTALGDLWDWLADTSQFTADMGLEIGTDVQAWSKALDDVATIAGQGSKFLKVTSGADGYEFRTAAEVASDIGAVRTSGNQTGIAGNKEFTGTVSFTTAPVITGSVPELRWIESDGTPTYNCTAARQNADSWSLRTLSNDGTFVGSDYYIVKGSAGPSTHGWFIGGTERLRLNANARVCINTPSMNELSSAAMLQTVATAAIAGVTIEADSTAGRTVFYVRNPNGVVGSISCSGSATAFNVSSDERLKDAIEDFTNSGEIIDLIRPRTFEWKANRGKRVHGFIAQELYQAFDEAVTRGTDSGELSGDGSDQWMLDNGKLMPVVVAELKSLRARVAALETA